MKSEENGKPSPTFRWQDTILSPLQSRPKNQDQLAVSPEVEEEEQTDEESDDSFNLCICPNDEDIRTSIIEEELPSHQHADPMTESECDEEGICDSSNASFASLLSENDEYEKIQNEKIFHPPLLTRTTQRRRSSSHIVSSRRRRRTSFHDISTTNTTSDRRRKSWSADTHHLRESEEERMELLLDDGWRRLLETMESHRRRQKENDNHDEDGTLRSDIESIANSDSSSEENEDEVDLLFALDN